MPAILTLLFDDIRLSSAQCLNTDLVMKGALCHICVSTLSHVLRKVCAKFKCPAE